jgi:hypothetical protein
MADALPADIREIAAAQVEVLAETVAGLSDAGLGAPTLCAGWLAAHLLAHARLGLQEQATGFAEPAGPGEAADRDYVTYWKDWPASGAPVTYGAVRFLWATSSAYATAESMRRHFADTARAAAGVSRRAPDGLFRFQDHVMDADDILAMWTVEWVVHQLDLTLPARPADPGRPPGRLPGDLPGPSPEAVALTVATLDGLLGTGTRPAGWDDVTYVLKGTGRMPLDDGDRRVLGERDGRFPAFG